MAEEENKQAEIVKTPNNFLKNCLLIVVITLVCLLLGGWLVWKGILLAADSILDIDKEECLEKINSCPADAVTDPLFIMVDSRDGQSYRIVNIDGSSWLTENIRYQGVPHFSADGNSENDSKYGYLYTWENAKKVCPAGWRLPAKEEFAKLVELYDAAEDAGSLRVTCWGESNNSSGFSALPAGDWDDGEYDHFCQDATFWSATAANADFAYSLCIFGAGIIIDDDATDMAYSVRCVKE